MKRAPRFRGQMIAAAVALASSAAVLGVASGATIDEATRATTLGAEAAITFTPAAQRWDGQDTATRAGSLAQRVPLPRGGNFNGVRWEDLEGATDDDINFILQFNAACQWLRAAADGRDAAMAAEVWKAIPYWPAMRRSGNAEVLVGALTEVTARSSGRESAVLAACRESHTREASFAGQRGLTPPV